MTRELNTTLTIRVELSLLEEIDRLVALASSMCPPGAKSNRNLMMVAAIKEGLRILDGVHSGEPKDQPKQSKPNPPAQATLPLDMPKPKTSQSRGDLLALLFHSDGSSRMSYSHLGAILGKSDSAIGHWRHGRHEMPRSAHMKIKALLRQVSSMEVSK